MSLKEWGLVSVPSDMEGALLSGALDRKEMNKIKEKEEEEKKKRFLK